MPQPGRDAACATSKLELPCNATSDRLPHHRAGADDRLGDAAGGCLDEGEQRVTRVGVGDGVAGAGRVRDEGAESPVLVAPLPVVVVGGGGLAPVAGRDLEGLAGSG